MDEITAPDSSWMQFSHKLELGRLEIEIIGGLVYGLGIVATVEKSPFYYGLFTIRLMLLCLFCDVSLFWISVEE